jgi:hypothetical protein
MLLTWRLRMRREDMGEIERRDGAWGSVPVNQTQADKPPSLLLSSMSEGHYHRFLVVGEEHLAALRAAHHTVSTLVVEVWAEEVVPRRRRPRGQGRGGRLHAPTVPNLIRPLLELLLGRKKQRWMGRDHGGG